MLSDFAGCAENSGADGIADDYRESEDNSQYGKEAARRSRYWDTMKLASSSWKWCVPTSRRSEYLPRS